MAEVSPASAATAGADPRGRPFRVVVMGAGRIGLELARILTDGGGFDVALADISEAAQDRAHARGFAGGSSYSAGIADVGRGSPKSFIVGRDPRSAADRTPRRVGPRAAGGHSTAGGIAEPLSHMAARTGSAGFRGEGRMTGQTTPRRHGTVADLGVGVLMLDTHFRRMPGDIGNARTWSFPVQFKIVKGASPHRVVQEADPSLLQPFIDAALELVGLGACGITTSCGFLAMFQKELQAALPVPVASSSLLQVPLAQAVLPAGRRVGILTFSAEKLTPRHLSAAGVPLDTPIDGLRKGDHFQQVYGDHGAEPDLPKMERELVAAAERMLERHPDVGAFVLECTNMPPHAAALRRATGLPVHDIVGFIEWFGRSLRPPAYPES